MFLLPCRAHPDEQEPHLSLRCAFNIVLLWQNRELKFLIYTHAPVFLRLLTLAFVLLGFQGRFPGASRKHQLLNALSFLPMVTGAKIRWICNACAGAGRGQRVTELSVTLCPSQIQINVLKP